MDKIDYIFIIDSDLFIYLSIYLSIIASEILSKRDDIFPILAKSFHYHPLSSQVNRRIDDIARYLNIDIDAVKEIGLVKEMKNQMNISSSEKIPISSFDQYYQLAGKILSI